MSKTRSYIIKEFFEGSLKAADVDFLNKSAYNKNEIFILQLAAMVKEKSQWLDGKLLFKNLEDKFPKEHHDEYVLAYINLILEAYV